MNYRHFIPLLIAVWLFSFSGCKKDTDNNQNQNLTFVKSEYYPMEVVSVNIGSIALTDSIYAATINGSAIQVFRTGQELVFFAPKLQAGTYPFQINLNGQSYNLPLQLISLPAIADADAYMQALQNNFNATSQLILQVADSLPQATRGSLAADLQSINNRLSDFQTQYNNLSATEKEECVAIIAANSAWMENLNTAAVDLLSDVSTYKTEGSIEDYDLKVRISMNKLVVAVTESAATVAKVVVVAAGGGILGSVLGGPIGAGVGATLGLGAALCKYWGSLVAVRASVEDIMNTSLMPYNDLTSEKTNALSVFTSGVPHSLTSTMSYRTLYNNDKNSSVTMVSTIVTALTNFKTQWNKLRTYAPYITSNPSTVEDFTTYNSKKIPVHSKYLSIGNITNSHVLLSNSYETNGTLTVVFHGAIQAPETFNYTVTYNNADWGTQTEAMDAIIYPGGFCPDSVADVDGNIYTTVRIGNQCWMAENLKTSHFADGSPIQAVQDSLTWGNNSMNNSTTPAWCYYNGNAAYNMLYGKLYNGYTIVDARHLCPAGWHVATDADYIELTDYLGGASTSAGSLRTIDYWSSPNPGATNSSGFSALPAGWREEGGRSVGDSLFTGFWTSTDGGNNTLFTRQVTYGSITVTAVTYGLNLGQSVRCVGD